MGNRKKAEKLALERLSQLEMQVDPKLGTTQRYRELFKQWSDKEFEAWIDSLRSKDAWLTLIRPNFEGKNFDNAEVVKMLDAIDCPVFERLILKDAVTGDEIMTPETYLVGLDEVRRQSQHLIKKQSIAKDTNTVDQATGQVTGASKGGALSLAETRLIAAKGLKFTALEALKARGGDAKAMQTMLADIREHGEWSMKPVLENNSVPQVTETVRAYLLAASLDNTLPTDRTSV